MAPRVETHELVGAVGISGSTPADMREVAARWEETARYCTARGFHELAKRDLRFAAAMRRAASIIEREDQHGADF